MIISVSDSRIELNGLPWYKHNGKKMMRLPKELEGELPDIVWSLSKNTSGVRIRFRSDTTSLGISADYDFIDTGVNFSPIGRHGIVLYVDGKCWGPIYPYTEKHVEKKYFEDIEKKFREFTLYLPNYSEVRINEISLDDNAEVLPPLPFSNKNPIIFYGSSITQGGCASHSGLSYQAMLCREMNLDFVNLGFSGSGKGEACIAEAIASIEACCYVIDFSQNVETVDGLIDVYALFLQTIRNTRRYAPMICVTPYFAATENFDPLYMNRFKDFRLVIKEAYLERKKAGDSNIYFVEGTDLITPDDYDCFVDGIHPNDLGFRKVADGLAKLIKDIL